MSLIIPGEERSTNADSSQNSKRPPLKFHSGFSEEAFFHGWQTAIVNT